MTATPYDDQLDAAARDARAHSTVHHVITRAITGAPGRAEEWIPGAEPAALLELARRAEAADDVCGHLDPNDPTQPRYWNATVPSKIACLDCAPAVDVLANSISARTGDTCDLCDGPAPIGNSWRLDPTTPTMISMTAYVCGGCYTPDGGEEMTRELLRRRAARAARGQRGGRSGDPRKRHL